MIKLLIVQEELSQYNIPLYNLLSKNYNVTVLVHKEFKIDFPKNKFNVVLLSSKHMFGFETSSLSLLKYIINSDVTILMFNLRWFLFSFILFFKWVFKSKLILWGIGVSASYKNEYDKNRKLDKIRLILMNLSDACIFYSDYPKVKYSKSIKNPSKLFSANNTIDVNLDLVNENIYRDKIIFVGTLYKEKGINELINIYSELNLEGVEIPPLYIIGKGSEFDEIQKDIMNRNLEDNIKLVGPIYDDNILSDYYNSAIFCVSPNQAGLSVLKSMAFAVPFVTNINAITGGEIFNINNNYNGITYSTYEELKEIFKNAYINKIKFTEMGSNANKFYIENCTMENMTNKFIEAINFTLEK